MELKLKLNEKETLIIQLDEELNPNQLRGLLLRLQKIAKLVDDEVLPKVGRPKKVIDPNSIPDDIRLPPRIHMKYFSNNKQFAKDFYYYTSTPEGRDAALQIMGGTTKNPRNTLSNFRWSLKKRFDL